MKMLIVGVGNADRGDDAAGILAARLLDALSLDDARIVEARGDAAALIALWDSAGAESVYLIDAMQSGSAPGTVRRFAAHEAPLPLLRIEGLTHGFGPVEAVELARALGMLPRRLIVFAIEGACFDAGAPVTPAVEEAAVRAAEIIRQECAPTHLP
ncbi:MAG: hydrogenase maturation protease [Anaerolineae bacterium]|nr:hydrogenase maturation protease [Anaerolineae bacterium]NUQ04027.1 hydrogenase maturation protease [Anaerolineae bacterium]